MNFENGSDQNLLLSHYLTTLTFAFYLNAPSRETHPPLAMQECVRGPETCPHLNDENEEASRGILRYVSNHLSQRAAPRSLARSGRLATARDGPWTEE